ncbi:MAG: hypothetical protein JNM00_09340 [Flavobacteriales bacterium]|nr:hypothetical protein [Flavobacteriales bacterium]
MAPTDNSLVHLLEHEHWANLRILHWLQQQPLWHEKVKPILDHLIAAHENWFARIEGRAPKLEVWWSDIHPDEYEVKLVQYHQSWKHWLEVGGAGKTYRYTNTKGDAFTNTGSEILTHLCLHSQYHRGQVTVLMRPLVKEIPSTDFIVWLRQR